MSDKINDGGPAFPNGAFHLIDGMSLRDYFAAKAMQGLISACDSGGIWTGAGDLNLNKTMTETAYAVADAMLKAREQ